MQTIREMQTRREAIRVEMRAIHDASPGGDLSTEAAARWAALETEADRLNHAERRQAMLDDLDRRATGNPLAEGNDRHYETEIRGFNITRAIAGAAGLPGVDAGRERELSAEIARRSGRQFQGIAVPMAALETRVFTTTNPGGGPGSNLIQTDVMGEVVPIRWTGIGLG
jgi:hypothetical protein